MSRPDSLQGHVSARDRWRIALNICIAVLAAGTWLTMVVLGGGLLTATGLRSLRYFTVLSNLFEAAACAAWIALFRTNTVLAEKIKYVAAVSVAVTFTVVMVFLGPLFGYASMFSGVNLPLHLIVPVASVLECMFMAETGFSRRDNLIAVLPVTVYGICYLLNNLINGIGEWPDTNDWYAFLTWGWPVGIGMFAVLCAATWVLGFVIRLPGRKRAQQAEVNKNK